MPFPLLLQRWNGPDAQLPREVNGCKEGTIWRKAHPKDPVLHNNYMTLMSGRGNYAEQKYSPEINNTVNGLSYLMVPTAPTAMNALQHTETGLTLKEMF